MESGVPNLLVGDHLFAWKGAARKIAPGRRQIWVFKLPGDDHTDFMKRLIGLPGDRVQYKNGRLFLNGTVLPRAFVFDAKNANVAGAKVYRETLPSGVSYLIQETADNFPMDNTLMFTVPEGHYFFLGDNRDNSLDSRSLGQVGDVPAENIRDFPTLIYWADEKSRIGTVVQSVP